MDAGRGRVALAMRIIELLSGTDRVSVRQVADELEITRSAAHRLLHEIEVSGYAVRGDGGRGYFAGPALVRQGHVPAVNAETRFRLRPVMQQVRELSQESVHVAILAGSRVLVVDGRRSAFSLDIGLRVGMVAPATTMAAGKLLLAALPNQTVGEIVGPDPLPRRSRFSLATQDQLWDELGRVRRRGSARTRQESEPGVNSVAVPLDGSTWRTRIALVVSVPVERGSPARMDELEKIARRAVDEGAARGHVVPWALDKKHRPSATD